MIFTVLTYIFVATSVIQIAYLFSFIPIIFHKTTNAILNETLPISVVVCAKNEVSNLNKLIPLLLNQEYKNFELVLINDGSNDETLEIMTRFQKQSSKIKIVNVKNNEAFWGNKKYALTLGIKAATNEHLLFTDADCIPSSRKWIQEMSNHFTESKTIILGYGAYKSKKNSFVNLMIRFETLIAAIQYFSYTKLGSPYMAVGRNLAYTKSDFFRVNGFIDHMRILSGDDDLFIRDAATSDNTNIALNSNSFTISEAPDTLKKWFHQKRRHISTSQYYKFKHQFFLGLFHGSKFIFFILAPLILTCNSSVIASSFLISYLLLSYITIGFCAKKFNEKNILYFLPFLELFIILFQIAIFMTNSISKPRHWK